MRLVPFAPTVHAPLLAAPLLGFDAPPLDLAAGSDLASATSLLLADDAVAGFDPVGAWTAFQDSHAVLLSFIAFIIYRAVIQEARMRIEKPIMDEAGRRVAENLTPDTKKLDGEAWAKLAGCILLDLAGDASELVPFLAEAALQVEPDRRLRLRRGDPAVHRRHPDVHAVVVPHLPVEHDAARAEAAAKGVTAARALHVCVSCVYLGPHLISI